MSRKLTSETDRPRLRRDTRGQRQQVERRELIVAAEIELALAGSGGALALRRRRLARHDLHRRAARRLAVRRLGEQRIGREGIVLAVGWLNAAGG